MGQESEDTQHSASDGSDVLLARARETATINAPIGAIDLARWIMTLTNDEYRSYAPGEHMGCGTSVTADGQPMSICTEMVGGQVMIQHYVGEIMTPTHCRMISLTDAYSNAKWTQVEVTWEIEVTSLGDGTCVFTNGIESRATPDFLKALKAAGVSVADVAAQRAASIEDHNRRETPQFAAGIERLSRAAQGV